MDEDETQRVLTIRLDEPLKKLIDKAAKASKQKRTSPWVRDTLRAAANRQLRASGAERGGGE